ncbi:MAG: hypothetical protein M3Q30_10405 [Actinomycetota bacterium]|nr:hypothetical protein [Actinomycetota bacterium]
MLLYGGVLVGLVGATGLCLIVAGLLRWPEPVATRRAQRVGLGVWSDRFALRCGLAVLGALCGLVVTRWPVVGVFGGAAGFAAPTLFGRRKARAGQIERLEALASWAETLRDGIGAAAGVQDALAWSARVAPSAIAPQVRELAARAERHGVRAGLEWFADELGDPVADLIVTALLVAASRPSSRLSEVLGETADLARTQASMRLRIEASRAKTYTANRLVVAVTVVLVAGIVAWNRSYLSPFDSAAGQVMLIVVGGLFSAGLIGVARLARVESGPRVFAAAPDAAVGS